MAKHVKILIVEDDKKFGESLAKVLSHEGFECVHADKPQTAISMCKLHSFDLALVDCMLPQMNGVDLAVKLKEITGGGIHLYLMSGIYKDRNFSVASLKKTGAKSFLIKPFELDALVTQLKENYGEKKVETITAEHPVKALFFQENITPQQVLSAVQSSREVNNSEVPLLLNSFINFKVAGTLTLSQNNESYSFYFKDGHAFIDAPAITSNQLRDYLSRKDFIIPEDLKAVKDQNFSLRGLQDLCLISPHFTDVIEKEFAIAKLYTIKQQQILNVSFKSEIPNKRLIALQPSESDDLIYDWVLSTPLVWFKSFFIKFMNCVVRKMSTSQKKTGLFPIVAANRHITNLMTENKTLAEVMSEAQADEETVFKLFHLLMVYRELFLGEIKQVTNHGAQLERLKSLLKSLDHQDAYERLGLMSTARDQDIKKAHNDLSQTLHPDKLKGAPSELIEISRQVYEKIQEAYNHIKSPEKREQYKRMLDEEKKEKQATSARLLDQALTQLMRGDFNQAEKLTRDAQEYAPHSQRLKLLQAWVQLKLKRQPPQQVSRTLQAISQDEKDTPIYFHVRGLLSLALNEIDKAESNFNSALSRDKNFVPSRRELSTMPKPEKKANVSIFTSDLKEVVGLFFKKK